MPTGCWQSIWRNYYFQFTCGENEPTIDFLFTVCWRSRYENLTHRTFFPSVLDRYSAEILTAARHPYLLIYFLHSFQKYFVVSLEPLLLVLKHALSRIAVSDIFQLSVATRFRGQECHPILTAPPLRVVPRRIGVSWCRYFNLNDAGYVRPCSRGRNHANLLIRQLQLCIYATPFSKPAVFKYYEHSNSGNNSNTFNFWGAKRYLDTMLLLCKAFSYLGRGKGWTL